MVEVQVIGMEDIKRLLKEHLLSGWVVVTGDLRCVEDFKRRYYGESDEDFVSRGIIYYARDSSGRLYPDVAVISLARKRKELEGLVGGGLERAIGIELKKVGDRCEAEVRYASSVFPRLSINRLVSRVIKSIEATALLRAKAARSQQPPTQAP